MCIFKRSGRVRMNTTNICRWSPSRLRSANTQLENECTEKDNGLNSFKAEVRRVWVWRNQRSCLVPNVPEITILALLSSPITEQDSQGKDCNP